MPATLLNRSCTKRVSDLRGNGSIREDDDHTPWFTSAGVGEIPIEVVPRRSAEQWMQAYHEAHKDDPEYQKEQEQRRARWGSPSKQQRKKWMESRNPDEMARFFRYMGKMMARAGQTGGRT